MLNIEKIVVRFTGAMMLAAAIGFVVWLSTERRGGLIAAGVTLAVGVGVSSLPLLLLALSKLVERARR